MNGRDSRFGLKVCHIECPELPSTLPPGRRTQRKRIEMLSSRKEQSVKISFKLLLYIDINPGIHEFLPEYFLHLSLSLAWTQNSCNTESRNEGGGGL